MAATQSESGRVLIVEDEPALLRALRINLRARGYEVATAKAGREALAEAARRPPDAVLLDLGLPDLDGNDVIRQLRAWSGVPVIVLSGRAGSDDKIGALDAGADDYVTKPFSMEELMARLRALLRRDVHPSSRQVFSIGHCTIDLAARTVVRRRSAPAASAAVASAEPGADAAGPANGAAGLADDAAGLANGAEQVHLTRTEWRMLAVLLDSPGQLVPSSRLLAELWGPGTEDSTHYLRFHMARLRRKLEDDPPRPRHLLTEPGMGYRFQP
jgi:two-component system, OmpR family, KDP operon response regulator KdpE